MDSNRHRGGLLLAAFGYLVFVIYGSLVPLDFRPQPLAAAWATFQQIPFLDLGIGSRADWVANLLLFVPLAFLWLGVMWAPTSRSRQILGAAFVLLIAFALSIAIEFTQIFFPQRTVSLNDIYAETLGAAIGIAAWWVSGSKIVAWFSGWSHTFAPAGVAARLLYLYLFVLVGYNVLPLDLTISPIEFFHKWREGKILLIPFSASFPTLVERIYALLADIAIWIPAAFLWRTSAPRTLGAVIARVVAAATLIELLQLFVYSRVTDVTQVLLAAVGGIVGGVLGTAAVKRSGPQLSKRNGHSPGLAPVLWFAGLLGIIGVLVAVFWYPFDFRTDWGFVHDRVKALQRAPLTAYYYGTEFRAATEVLHKVGFFLPLGAWLAIGAHAALKRYRIPAYLLHAAAVTLIAAIAAAIVTGRVFLPSKYPDLADWVLQSFGGLCGYFGLRLILLKRRSADIVEARTHRDVDDRAEPTQLETSEPVQASIRAATGGRNELPRERTFRRRIPVSPAMDVAPAGSLLVPLAVALLAWLACAGMLDLRAGSQASASAPGLSAILGHGWHLMTPLLAGLLLQSSTTQQAPARRLWKCGAMWTIWTAVGIAFQIAPQRLGLDAPWSVGTILLQQVGLVSGLAAGWFVSSSLAAQIDLRLAYARPVVSALAGLATALIILVPVAADTLLARLGEGWLGNSALGYGRALLAQFYVLLKALILWVPLGMLYGFARRKDKLASWAAIALLAFLIVSPALPFSVLRVADLLEIAGAYWGIALGLWLGTTVLKDAPVAAAEPIAAESPVALADRGPPASSIAQSMPRVIEAEPTPSIKLEEVSPPLGSSQPDQIRPLTLEDPEIPLGTTGLAPQRSTTIARRLAAALVLVTAVAWAWSFPRWGPWLVGGLALYIILLGKYRHAWLLAVPAALPLLNLAPGTGRFFFDEFDILLLATAAMALWHGRERASRARFSRPFLITAGIFGVAYFVSVLIGVLPLAPLDANAFSSYWSNYNALRVAKGLGWAIALAAILRWTVALDATRITRFFMYGMLIGLAGVIAVGVWERWLFASLFDLSVRYRITATFGSMHTGGSQIEAYLVMTLPFAWLAIWKGNHPATRLAGLALLMLGAYLMALTIARGGILAMGVVIVCLAISGWRAHAGIFKGAVIGAAALAVTAAVLAVGIAGGYLQTRFASVAEDWATRSAHWTTALSIRDDDLTTKLFGMGIGRFPATFLLRAPVTDLPGNYSFRQENGDTFLSLGGGEVLYMAQRAAVVANQRYSLTLRARTSTANARLGVPVCEKHLLNSRKCVWNVLPVPSDGQWNSLSLAIDSGTVGAGNLLTRRPVELSLFNDSEGGRIDVDDVALREAAGGSLIQNGDFSAGSDYWFFKTHSYLPWRVENLWISLLFEQGWFGLIAFPLLLAAAVFPLARALWHGDRLSGALLAAIGGFLTVGIVNSPFDAPRIALLFFLLLVLGDGNRWRNA